MKNGKKKLACVLLTLFFISTFSITSFVKTVSASADTTNSAAAPWIASDLPDYSPGALVTLTGGNWTGDSEVKIAIEGSSNGTQAWSFEKVVTVTSEGLIELQFNLPKSYVPQYKATATGLTTGSVATTTFTDSGGSYTLDFQSYDPRYYDFKFPGDYPTPPSGQAEDPMPGANGSHKTVESLEPKDLALGQIVPFEVEINVNGSTAQEGGIIDFTCLWDTQTTNGSAFGFDPKYMVFAAFVDTKDPRSVDPEKNASAEILSSEKDGTNIKGNIQVSGLDNGDTIIVEMWVVLQSQLPDKVSGNVQSRLESAQTANGDTINTGDQTVPLNKPADFRTVTAEVGIVKTDTPDPLYAGDTLTYSVTVTNNSTEVVANDIAVTDTLDPKVTFVSASDEGVLGGSQITWPAFALEPEGVKIFTVTVNVNPDAPTDICAGTAPDIGLANGIRLTNADVSNIVQFTMLTQDSNYDNNVWQEPTNVLPKFIITAYKVWVGGPAADHMPVTLTLYRHVGSGTPEVVTDVTPTITPSTGPADKFTYVWTGLPTYDSNLQPYIYTVDETSVPEGYTKTITENNTITNTYKPSLVILKVYGTAPLEGAVFELYAGDANGPTGEALVSITTGSDGKGTFAHMEDGLYWIKEAKPPLGYKFIDDIGPFTVSNGAITGPTGYTPAADGTTGNYIITVQNQPVGQLPLAGGRGTIPFAAGGMGIMMLAIFLGKRNRINKGEKI